MIACKSFHNRLLQSLPYTVRTFVEGTLQSLASSEAALNVLKTSINGLISERDADPAPTIVAIGSFGRLDGHIMISDVDVIHIYAGAMSSSRVDELHEFLRDLIQYNAGLLFDHRREILERRFNFAASPAYPMIAADDLRIGDNEHRALQLLTEGRVLRNGHGVGDIRAELLAGFGFSDDISRLNMGKFRSALAHYRDSYCSGVMDRATGAGWSLSNKKVIKLFALREFSYLATLFSLAEVSLAVALGTGSVATALERLSSPSVLKVASFCDPAGPLAGCVNKLSGAAKKRITKLVQSHVKSLPEAEQMAIVEDIVNPAEGEFFREVRNLTVAVLKQYDCLLTLLHDSGFLASIEKFEPDVTSWLGRPPYQAVLRAREKMLQRARLLAQTLSECLAIVGESGNFVIEHANAPLEEIAAYELRLDFAAARV